MSDDWAYFLALYGLGMCLLCFVVGLPVLIYRRLQPPWAAWRARRRQARMWENWP